jgi:signal peptidase II
MKPVALYGPCSGLGLSAALAVFLLDQAFKTWMLYNYGLVEGERLKITPFLDIILVWNIGVSYGFLPQESMLGQHFLAIFKISVSFALALWLAQVRDRATGLAIGLIIGGALGNALDRMLYGAVADFFSLHFGGFYWYIFNIADVAIVAGVALLLYDGFVLSRKAGAEKSKE